MGTSVERTSNVTDLSKLGLSFEMPSESVDGMRPETVADAIRRAADRARAGEGPTLLDIQTYRYKGHSMSDPQKYRTKEEVEKFKEQRDPITTMRNHLVNGKIASEEALKKIEDEVKAQINDAAEFAKESPEPEVTELWTEITQ